jgi:transposase InsO family protein
LAVAQRHYGYRRLTELVRREGWAVNHKRVLRLMRTDNLLCLRRRAFVPATTDSRHRWRVVANLARDLDVTGVDQLWVADITYVRLLEEFAFLAIVLDAFSRRVIGWALEVHQASRWRRCRWHWGRAARGPARSSTTLIAECSTRVPSTRRVSPSTGSSPA